MAPWDYPDFDEHEGVHFFRDAASGLSAIIAIHSTHLGPAAGGCRYWSYAKSAEAVTDALRLSRGMSYKNAMAGLPMGGGKAVILADPAHPKSPELLAAFGRSVEALGGRYVTAEDVGISDADMVEVSKQTKHVSGLPVAGRAAIPARSPRTGSIWASGRRCAGRSSARTWRACMLPSRASAASAAVSPS